VIRPEQLQGSWVHAHEEDSGPERVFRPEGHPLPLARGRTTLELRPDGTYVEGVPGPVDLPVQATGTWSLDGDRLVLGATEDRPERAWTVLAAGGDRLAVLPD
jgi:hypothetical protein